MANACYHNAQLHAVKGLWRSTANAMTAPWWKLRDSRSTGELLDMAERFVKDGALAGDLLRRLVGRPDFLC